MLLSSNLLAVASLSLYLAQTVSSALTAEQCTFPDGSQHADFVPCNPDGNVSSCCASGDACLNNGLCYGASGVPYRGGCAGGWGDEASCPSICPSGETQWANLYSCGDGDFFCGSGTICQVGEIDGSGVSSPTGFILSNLTQTRNAMGVARIAVDSDGDSTGSSSEEDDDDVDNCPTDRTLPITLAVGVPLAIIAIGLGLWVLIERQKRMMLDRGHRAPSIHFDAASRSQSRSASRAPSRAGSRAGSLGSPGWAGRNFTESDVTVYGVEERLDSWSRNRDGLANSSRRKDSGERRSTDRTSRSLHLARSEPNLHDERRERRGRSGGGRRSEDRLVEREVEWDREVGAGRGDLTFELPVRRPAADV